MRLQLSYITGYRFIKAFLTKPQKQPQTGSLFPAPLPTEQLLRQILLVSLPVVALALSLYLLLHINDDIFGEIPGDTNTSSIPLPQNSSIVTKPLLNP